MAGEWIPIRTDIFDCPQVVRILSKLCPDSVRDSSERVRQTSTIVGALVRMWSLFDRYTEDGFLKNYSSEVLDQMVGMVGFSAAVVEVGWLVIVDNGLQMPEFSKYLSKTAKTRMKDSQRKKAERAASKDCPENVQELSDKIRTTIQDNTTQKNLEIQKESLAPSRASPSVEEPKGKKKPKPDFSEHPLPKEIDTPQMREAWRMWCKHRKEIGHALTETQMMAQMKELVKVGERQAIRGIEFTVSRGWQGLRYPEESEQPATVTREKTQAEKDAILAEVRARRAMEDGRDGS